MYDPIAYWTEAGRTYAEDHAAGRIGHGYELQEERLLAFLGRLSFRTVLEVGCGFGRITKLVAERWPAAEITAIDLSADQLRTARRRVPSAKFVHSTIQSFPRGKATLQDRQWDLVLAVEVLMHVPPDELPDVVAKLRALSGHHLVTLDWSEERRPPVIAPWNFPHDYAALFGEAASEQVARQRIFHVHRPHPGRPCS